MNAELVKEDIPARRLIAVLGNPDGKGRRGVFFRGESENSVCYLSTSGLVVSLPFSSLEEAISGVRGQYRTPVYEGDTITLQF